MAHTNLFNANLSPLKTKVFDEAAIYPNSQDDSTQPCGLFVGNRYIKNTSWYGHDILDNKKNIDLDYINEEVIYIGQLHKCWGHFITDSLARLWYVINNKSDKTKIVYIAHGGFKMVGNYKRLFELLEISQERLIEIKKPTRFRKVILPDLSFRLVGEYSDQHRVFTCEYKDTIELLKKNCTSLKKFQNKIYFTSRSYKRSRREFGEEKIEKYLKTKGFMIVKPELFCLDDQISMIKNCDYFVSTDGSCGHNVIFMKDGANAIIIPRGPYRSGFQDTLNQVNNINVYYIDSTLSVLVDKKHPHQGPFYFYVSENLQSFFDDEIYNVRKYLRCNFYDIKKYFHYGLSLKKDYLISSKCAEVLFHYLFLIESNTFRCRIKQKIKRLVKKFK